MIIFMIFNDWFYVFLKDHFHGQLQLLQRLSFRQPILIQA